MRSVGACAGATNKERRATQRRSHCVAVVAPMLGCAAHGAANPTYESSGALTSSSRLRLRSRFVGALGSGLRQDDGSGWGLDDFQFLRIKRRAVRRASLRRGSGAGPSRAFGANASMRAQRGRSIVPILRLDRGHTPLRPRSLRPLLRRSDQSTTSRHGRNTDIHQRPASLIAELIPAFAT